MRKFGDYKQVNKTVKLLKDNGFKVVRKRDIVEGFMYTEEGEVAVYRALKLAKGAVPYGYVLGTPWTMWYNMDVFAAPTT